MPTNRYSIGEALSWAWAKFTKNAIPLVVATLVAGLIFGVVVALLGALVNAASPSTFDAYNNPDGVVGITTTSMSGASTAIGMLGWIVIQLVLGVIASAYYGGLLDLANGQRVAIGSFFRPRKVASVVLAALIIGAVSTLVTFPFFLLPIIGPLIAIAVSAAVSIFTVFTTVAIVDRGLPPIDGIKASIGMAKANFGEVLLAWLISDIMLFIGAVLCFIGLLVAAPLSFLFIVYTYRKLSGGSVAPAIG